MKKLMPFLFVLLLVACEKSEEQIPTCQLTEESFYSSSRNPQGQNSHRYTYEAGNKKPVKIEFYTGEEESFEWGLTYDAKGNLRTKEHRSPDGTIIMGRDVFTYDTRNLLTKWEKFGGNRVDGILEPTDTYLYEYTSPTQLKKATIHKYINVAGSDIPVESTYYYEYENDLMRKITIYMSPKANPDFILELQYDNKKNPYSGSMELLDILEHDLVGGSSNIRAGYPYKHNRIVEIYRYEIPEYENKVDTYVHTYTYNEAGYPVSKSTTTSSFPSGKYESRYSYQCP